MKRTICMCLGVVCGLLVVSCGRHKVSLPVQTSLGQLVAIEQKDTVATDKGAITPGAGEVLYQLTFEGRNELAYEGKPREDGFARVLVDSTLNEFEPAFAGTPRADGTISHEKWTWTGFYTGDGTGRTVFKGSVALPEPKLTLVYKVPRAASGLMLRDGNQLHPVQ